MQAGKTYPCGHLVSSPFLALAYVKIIENSFPELAVSFPDFSPWKVYQFQYLLFYTLEPYLTFIMFIYSFNFVLPDTLRMNYNVQQETYQSVPITLD